MAKIYTTLKSSQDSNMECNITITIGKVRKDGKFPVKYFYQGSPNMFGGREHGRTYSKLDTAQEIGKNTLYDGDTLTNNSGLPDSHFFEQEQTK
jgi:hypothetical protein